jgi:hypothetical protein
MQARPDPADRAASRLRRIQPLPAQAFDASFSRSVGSGGGAWLRFVGLIPGWNLRCSTIQSTCASRWIHFAASSSLSAVAILAGVQPVVCASVARRASGILHFDARWPEHDFQRQEDVPRDRRELLKAGPVEQNAGDGRELAALSLLARGRDRGVLAQAGRSLFRTANAPQIRCAMVLYASAADSSESWRPPYTNRSFC